MNYNFLIKISKSFEVFFFCSSNPAFQKTVSHPLMKKEEQSADDRLEIKAPEIKISQTVSEHPC